MRLFIILILIPFQAVAESLIAARTLPAQTVISPADLLSVAAAIDGALTDPTQAIGLEARVTIYAGRPVLAVDIGPPAVIERNARVTLVYRSGGLVIRADGRALARGTAGETVRAMNLTSKNTVSGQISADGTIQVAPPTGALP